MENMKGMIVKCVSGRDGGSWFAVLEQDDGFVYIADGKSRKVEKPKKKNAKHVRASKKFTEAAGINVAELTNKKLRKILRETIGIEDAENIAEEG